MELEDIPQAKLIFGPTSPLALAIRDAGGVSIAIKRIQTHHDLLAVCREIDFFGSAALAAAGWDKPHSMLSRLRAAIAKAQG